MLKTICPESFFCHLIYLHIQPQDPFCMQIVSLVFLLLICKSVSLDIGAQTSLSLRKPLDYMAGLPLADDGFTYIDIYMGMYVYIYACMYIDTYVYIWLPLPLPDEGAPLPLQEESLPLEDDGFTYIYTCMYVYIHTPV